MIYKQAQRDLFDPMSKTPPPTDPRADFLDLTTDPYTALGLRTTTYPLPNSDSLEDVKLVTTVAIDPLLRNVPVLRTARIYKLTYVQIYLLPKQNTEAGSAESAVMEPVAKPFTAYLVEKNTAEQVLEHYGTNMQALQDFQNTVLGRFSAVDDMFFYPDIAENSGHRLLVQAFDIPATGVGIEALADGVPLADSETPVYVCVKSLLAVAAIYELASRRGSKMPQLPNNAATVFIKDDTPHYRVYNGALGWFTGAINPEGRQQDVVQRIMRHVRNAADLREDLGRTAKVLLELATSAREATRNARKAMGQILRGQQAQTTADIEPYIPLMTRFRDTEGHLEREQQLLAGVWFELAAMYAKKAGEIIEAAQRLNSTKTRLEVLQEANKDTRAHQALMPANLGAIYPYFALIPTGHALDITEDRLGRRLIMHRANMRNQREHPQLELGLSGGQGSLDLDEPNKPLIIRAAEQLKLNPGLIGMAVVGAHKWYMDQGGFSGYEPSSVVMTVPDFIRTIRPNADLSRGIKEAIASDPDQLFWDTLRLMQGLSFEVPNMNPDVEREYISGLMHIEHVVEYKSRDRGAVRMRYNTSLFDVMVHGGSLGIPQYMMCNTRAMFDYHPRRMAYGPSMQLGLENLFRINMNKGDNHKDRSDFIVVRRNLDFLANMIGLSNMPVSQAQRTVETYLQIMVDNGVLSKFKPVAGTGGVEKLKRQYELISGKGYAMQRQEQREKSTVKALERFLADPLSPQRQPKQPGVDSKDKLSTPQRRRGRPKKSGT